MKTEKYWQNTQNFGMVLKMKLKQMVIKKDEYGKDFEKIKFNTNDVLPLNNPLKFPALTIIARSVFKEDSKFYVQVYLDGCFDEL